MPIIVAALPAGGYLFTSPPKNPGINEPLPAKSPPPLPLPQRRRRPPPPANRPPPPNSSSRNAPRPALDSKHNPALKAMHSRTHYYKPVSDGAVLADDQSGRAVVVGPSGVSYRLPDAPFDFQFSYSETPKAKPLAIREPAFLPFAPPTMNRPWTGKAPLVSKKDKERKKKNRLFEPLGQPDEKEKEEEQEQEDTAEGGKVMLMARKVLHLGRYPKDSRSREEILGEPLKRSEVQAFLKPLLSSNRQVNLGRDGLTHNMLELVHTHWRRQEVCKVRCRGVPTVDMKNICRHLEEKTGGKIIFRVGGVVYLFRGRNYDPRKRPRYPIMLWKPAAPVYPKLIQDVPEGLTKMEADEFRKKGQSLLPICNLAKNGIYINLVKDVRDAFEGSELVKINCEGMEPSDYKKLGAKLKELVPCVLLSFDNEQILIWRGKNWKSRYQTPLSFEANIHQIEDDKSTEFKGAKQSGRSVNECAPVQKTLKPKILSLWEHAIVSCKAMLLDDTALSPDSLLEKVEEFEALSQAKEHSYQALILPSGVDPGASETAGKVAFETKSNYGYNYNDSQLKGREAGSEDPEYDYEDVSDKLDGNESSIPFGSLPVDSIVEKLHQD